MLFWCVGILIGNKQDSILDIDNAPERSILDKSTNKYGDDLYKSLLDYKMCIVNGRVTPDFNNWISTSTKGKSWLCNGSDGVSEYMFNL